MSFKGISIFSSGGHFVQGSRTILAILVEGHPRGGGGGWGGWVTSYIWHSTGVHAEWPPISALPGI